MTKPRGWALAALLLVAAATACGGGGEAEDDPLALAGTPSDACTQAIVDGHNMEAARQPAPFLPSVRVCGSLAEWTAAAKAFGSTSRPARRSSWTTRATQPATR